MAPTRTSGDYTAKHIKTLDPILAIQRSPGVPLGDMTTPYNAIKEVIDNAGDEAIAGAVKGIYVHWDSKLHECIVCDDGRGIPVEKAKEAGNIPAVIAVFTRASTGGKFERGEAYSLSVGTHGVGAKATNALAAEFNVWTHRDGKWWHVAFKYGKQVTKLEVVRKPILTAGVFGKRGTQIRVRFSGEKYAPLMEQGVDSSIWFDTLKIDPQVIRTRCFDLAYLVPGLTVTFQNAEKKPEELHFDHGVVDFVTDEVARLQQDTPDIKPMHEDIFTLDSFKRGHGGVRLALQWTSDDSEHSYSYVNCSPTKAHGVHYQGVVDAITEAVARFGHGRRGGGFQPEDLRVGLVMALNVFAKDPKFEHQTKGKLTHPKALAQEVHDQVLPGLYKFFRKRRELAKEIVVKARELRALINRTSTERKALKGLRTKGSNSQLLLEKYCDTKKGCRPIDRELYIVEGDSAFEPVRAARDPAYQAILAMKGKPPNTTRKTIAEIADNKEIQRIIQAVGAGVGEECKVERARVGKILIMADADPDGKHIAALVLALFCEHMQPIVEAGMIYVVDSPLFMAQMPNGRHVFGHTKGDLRRKLGDKDFQRATASGGIHRFKGHGEANPDQILEYAMDTKTRRLFRLQIDPKQGYRLVREVMGDDGMLRKELLGITGDMA